MNLRKLFYKRRCAVCFHSSGLAGVTVENRFSAEVHCGCGGRDQVASVIALLQPESVMVGLDDSSVEYFQFHVQSDELRYASEAEVVRRHVARRSTNVDQYHITWRLARANDERARIDGCCVSKEVVAAFQQEFAALGIPHVLVTAGVEAADVSKDAWFADVPEQHAESASRAYALCSGASHFVLGDEEAYKNAVLVADVLRSAALSVVVVALFWIIVQSIGAWFGFRQQKIVDEARRYAAMYTDVQRAFARNDSIRMKIESAAEVAGYRTSVSVALADVARVRPDGVRFLEVHGKDGFVRVQFWSPDLSSQQVFVDSLNMQFEEVEVIAITAASEVRELRNHPFKVESGFVVDVEVE